MPRKTIESAVPLITQTPSQNRSHLTREALICVPRSNRTRGQYITFIYSLSFLLLPLGDVGHQWNVLFHFSFLILRQLVGLLGRGISTSRGSYLHGHRINADKHPCVEVDSNSRSQRSRERRQFMPQTARPLWSALLITFLSGPLPPPLRLWPG
jgi:hypothetical protein